MTCQSALDQRRGSLVQSPACLCSKEAQSRGTLGIVNESIHKVRPQMFQHVSTCFNMFQQSVAYAGNLHQSKLGILCSKSNLRDGESKAKSCMTCPTSLGKCSAKVECCPSRFPKFSSNFHMGLSENRVSSFRWAFWGYTPCSDSQITILLLISHI